MLALVRRDVSAFDRWERLRSVGRLDGLGGPSARVVALTEDATPVTPLGRLRLLRAGATEVHVAGQLATGALLDALVRLRADRSELGAGRVGRIEFGPRCDPSAVVDHVLAKAEEDEAYVRAFHPEVAQNRSGLSRRRAHTLRVKVANLGDLRSPAPCGGGPVRDLPPALERHGPLREPLSPLGSRRPGHLTLASPSTSPFGQEGHSKAGPSGIAATEPASWTGSRVAPRSQTAQLQSACVRSQWRTPSRST